MKHWAIYLRIKFVIWLSWKLDEQPLDVADDCALALTPGTVERPLSDYLCYMHLCMLPKGHPTGVHLSAYRFVGGYTYAMKEQGKLVWGIKENKR